MPTKRVFDLVVLTGLLLKPAVGLVKLWAARHSTHEGLDGVVAQAVAVTL